MSEIFIHEHFHTKHSVFTAPDAHMHTSLSYTLRDRQTETQTETQTDRQTETETHIETETERD